MASVHGGLGRGLIGLALSTALLAGFASDAGAQRARPAATPARAPVPRAPDWPQAKSDLAPDPTVTFGVLPNGMRYAIMKNATPPGQVSMRLRIAAGSMQETKDQEGLAHFLEHMAFRGSTHLADGEVFKSLERLGLAPGADTNAGTGANQTVYQFDLPKSDDETVDRGLMILREIGGELLLKQETMDAERNVILSEERARDNPTAHASKVLAKLMYKDHPFGRPPIGDRAVISTAPVSRIKAFYDAYYRPERATLVVVGDIDPAALEAKIKGKFSDWQGHGAPGVDPKPLVAAPGGSQAKFYSEAGIAPQMIVAWTQTQTKRADTKAREVEKMYEAIAFGSLNTRFADLTRDARPPFLAGIALNGEIPDVADITQLAAIGPTDWKAALSTLVTTERQAVEQGLRQDEIDRTIVQVRTALQAQVAGASSRRTPNLVAGLLGSASSDSVYLSPAQQLALFEEATKSLTLDKANALLKARFKGAGPVAFIAMPAPIEGGEAAVVQAFAAASTAPVVVLAKVDAKPWPHTGFGSPGTVAERKTIDDLGVTMVRFANGVRLTIKPTDFTKDQILVRVRTGFGMLELPKDRVTAVEGIGTRLVDGGLVDLTAREVSRSLEGKVVGASSSVGDAGFILAGSTRPLDFDLQMQLLTAYQTKPGWRSDGLDANIQFTNTMFQQAASIPSSLYSLKAPLLLHSGDQRWRTVEPAELSAMKVDEVKAFMTPILAKAPVEIVIVGDITVDRAIDGVAKTFGALPAREERRATDESKIVKFPAATPMPIVLNHKGRADQALAVVAWPNGGYRDRDGSAPLRLAQLVLQDRLFDELRVKQGKTYSPSSDVFTNSAFPDYGYTMVQTETPPKTIAGVLATIDQIAADLAEKDVTPDELDRARKPRIESWGRNFRTNGYWIGALAGAQLDPDLLDNPRTIVPRLQAVTAADVRKAAKAYLVKDRAWRMTVVPEVKVAQATAN